MRPMKPIVPGLSLPVTEFAKDQPEYNRLPAYRSTAGVVLSRWHLTWRERLRLLLFGDVYLTVHTFNQPLQPVRLVVERPTNREIIGMLSRSVARAAHAPQQASSVTKAWPTGTVALIVAVLIGLLLSSGSSRANLRELPATIAALSDARSICVKDPSGSVLTMRDDGQYVCCLKEGEQFFGKASVEKQGAVLIYEDRRSSKQGLLGHVDLESHTASFAVSIGCKSEILQSLDIRRNECGACLLAESHDAGAVTYSARPGSSRGTEASIEYAPRFHRGGQGAVPCARSKASRLISRANQFPSAPELARARSRAGSGPTGGLNLPSRHRKSQNLEAGLIVRYGGSALRLHACL